MTRNKIGGNEEQRREQPPDATQRGESPRTPETTEAATGQRHVPRHASHAEKLAAIRRGARAELGPEVTKPKPRPGSR